MQSTPADLVADTKFRVEFHADFVHRFTFHSSNIPDQYVRRMERLDIWKNEKEVGSGSFGNVWLQRCLTSEDQSELQAVKMVRKRKLSSNGIDFFKELEAMAKFSQRKI
ncbi:kinase-like protein [Penicillium fimorum]|uniref:Kinase-like protein n=1 Tax=Penicillium fimorum TaxID=1882269 RepID=A0A9X0C7X7_9EURO|nr:kinase-like protein [Penicillium fimorum]